MKILKPGSQLHRLISLLSVCGEFSVKSLDLLGNKRLYRRVVSECTVPVTLQNPITKETISLPKIFILTGKGRMKSIRLYKGARPILTWIGEGNYYDSICYGYNMPMTTAHVDRNHRVAETLAAFMDAGFYYLPHTLPRLKSDGINRIITTQPLAYPSRMLKLTDNGEGNKTGFSRITGAVFAGGDCYAVYNTRNAVMKWSGKGETKAMVSLKQLSIVNSGIDQDRLPVLFFGASHEVAFRSMLAMRKATNINLRFDMFAPRIHFIPLNRYGARFIKFISIPRWREHLLELLFGEDQIVKLTSFEYDAKINGTYILSHLDSDLCRLNRFREAIIDEPDEKYEVLCFEWQYDFVKKFLDDLAKVTVISFDEVDKELSEYYSRYLIK
ncbi:MAG: hypothetical protein IJE25_05745 [Clostridia bacterium]|nr:hypothetical protein [Clostridia bacterium]